MKVRCVVNVEMEGEADTAAELVDDLQSNLEFILTETDTAMKSFQIVEEVAEDEEQTHDPEKEPRFQPGEA